VGVVFASVPFCFFCDIERLFTVILQEGVLKATQNNIVFKRKNTSTVETAGCFLGRGDYSGR